MSDRIHVIITTKPEACWAHTGEGFETHETAMENFARTPGPVPNVHGSMFGEWMLTNSLMEGRGVVVLGDPLQPSSRRALPFYMRKAGDGA